MLYRCSTCQGLCCRSEVPDGCPHCGAKKWFYLETRRDQATPNSPQLKPMHPAVGFLLTALIGCILVALVVYSF